MHLHKKNDIAATLPIFADLSKADLRKVTALMTPVDLKAGQQFIKEGTPGREAFFIIDGNATVRRGGRVLATLGPGDVIGEMSVLAGTPRSASVTAETPMRVEVLNRREFSALLDEVPGLAKKIMTAVIKRLHELEPNLAG